MSLNNCKLCLIELAEYVDFSEPSTWRGVVLLATSAGVTLAPESIEMILVAMGMFVNGAIGLKKDK